MVIVSTSSAAVLAAREAAVRPTRLILFSSRRSGPARRVEAFLDQVLQERRNHHTFSRYQVDIELQPELAERFEVSVVPTILIVDGAHIEARIEGRVGVADLRDALARWLR